MHTIIDSCLELPKLSNSSAVLTAFIWQLEAAKWSGVLPLISPRSGFALALLVVQEYSVFTTVVSKITRKFLEKLDYEIIFKFEILRNASTLNERHLGEQSHSFNICKIRCTM